MPRYNNDGRTAKFVHTGGGRGGGFQGGKKYNGKFLHIYQVIILGSTRFCLLIFLRICLQTLNLHLNKIEESRKNRKGRNLFNDWMMQVT